MDKCKNIATLRTLTHYNLKKGLDVVLELDDDGSYLITSVDLPLYANHSNLIQAFNIIKEEIETYFTDLIEESDDHLLPELLTYKRFLESIIVKREISE